MGEPLNIIIANTSSPDVMEPERFLIWATYVHTTADSSALGFGVSCLGQGDPQTVMYANLGRGNERVRQGSESGMNGVLRWNYGMPDMGTCKQSISGGNHFRWFVQKHDGVDSIFLAASDSQSLANGHRIITDGYNLGRDRIVGNATKKGGIEWKGNKFNATVKWIKPGILMNATSQNISHADMAAEGKPVVDGRVAVLYIHTVERNDEESPNAAARGVRATAMTFVALALGALVLCAL